jgi:hypothetical protein
MSLVEGLSQADLIVKKGVDKVDLGFWHVLVHLKEIFSLLTATL